MPTAYAEGGRGPEGEAALGTGGERQRVREREEKVRGRGTWGCQAKWAMLGTAWSVGEIAIASYFGTVGSAQHDTTRDVRNF